MVLSLIISTQAQKIIKLDDYTIGPKVDSLSGSIAFKQCKKNAEKITSSHAFDSVLFKNVLKTLDTSLIEVKCFKAWGDIMNRCDTPVVLTPNQYSLLNIGIQAYGLLKNSLSFNEQEIIWQINTMQIIVLPAETENRSWVFSDENLVIIVHAKAGNIVTFINTSDRLKIVAGN